MIHDTTIHREYKFMLLVPFMLDLQIHCRPTFVSHGFVTDLLLSPARADRGGGGRLQFEATLDL